MVTWYQLAGLRLAGRDILIEFPGRTLRGPIECIELEGELIRLCFTWVAELNPGKNEWILLISQQTVEYYENGSQTIPTVRDDGSIQFHWLVANGLVRAYVCLPEDKLTESEVLGLDGEIEISEEASVRVMDGE